MMRGDVPEARWQMVTFTLSHHAGESLQALLDGVMQAFRKVRRTRVIREIFDERVTASVRALEVTWGKNGWHPHIHLLLRTEEWPKAERELLEREWLRHVPGDLAHAVKWSTPIEAWHKERVRYIGKLGAEVAGIAKEAKNGNLTPWQLAERVLEHSGLAARWKEYQETMRGRRTLEFDERAKALLERAPEREEPMKEWRIDIFAEEFAELATLEKAVPTILWEILETARHAGPDPPMQVRITIDDACELSRKAA